MRRAAAIVLLSLWAATPHAQQTPTEPPSGTLLADESAGVVEVEDESSVQVVGFTGKISFRIGKHGEMRFMSADPGAANQKVPVHLWLDEGTFRIEPGPGGAARNLEVVIPDSLRAAVRASDARVTASGIRSGLDVRGSRLEIDARGTGGGVSLDLETSRIQLDTIDGDVSVHGRAIEGRVAHAPGTTNLRVSASRLELSMVGRLEVDVADTTLTVGGASDPVRIRATGGRTDLTAILQGGEFRMTGAPLSLQKSKGDMDIESDSDVGFSEMEASIHVNGYGAKVHGSRNQGLLEVRMDGGEVAVERIDGALRVQGARLKVKLQHVGGDLFADVAGSELAIDDPAGPVGIISESSNVSVSNASAYVEIRAKGGELRIVDLRGSLDVEADTERVEVSWAALYPDKDSSVKNENGAVEMRFPPNAALRISATTKFGRIESTMPGLHVDDGALAADGSVGMANSRKAVRIEAGGDIVLGTGALAGPAD